ncbi:unnamed protein product [Ectocarpus sp. 12 AP-2014]
MRKWKNDVCFARATKNLLRRGKFRPLHLHRSSPRHFLSLSRRERERSTVRENTKFTSEGSLSTRAPPLRAVALGVSLLCLPCVRTHTKVGVVNPQHHFT